MQNTEHAANLCQLSTRHPGLPRCCRTGRRQSWTLGSKSSVGQAVSFAGRVGLTWYDRLEWVRANIEAFGGDPEKITLWVS